MSAPDLYRSHMVPTVVDKTTQGEHSFDIFSRLLRERVVMVGSPIGDQVANLVVAQLLFLEAEDPDKDVSLYINSPGGTIYSGLAIYDTMQYIKPDVATTCVGMAMSMGAMLLCGGAAGKRHALPNSKVMIHQGSGEFEGTAADIEIHAAEVLSLRERTVQIIAHHSGQSIEQVETDIDRDLFMAPDEAKAYGLVDDVVTGRVQ
ncbi:MAG: ATP-dependent Clp protease proteolytic subunit [Actinomycetota bacterium]